MHRRHRLAAWAPAVLFAAGLAALYATALGTGFLNDDYLFLEQARSRPLGEWLGRLDALGNYWRPLSRQLYFEAMAQVGAERSLAFHLVNFAVFLGSLALLADLLRAFAGPAGVLAGVAWFALLPLQRVNLTWISCSQDLLALMGTLGALALWRRNRTRLALLAWLAALASKESALPLPLAFLAWERLVERRTWAAAARRVTPAALVGAGALAIGWWVRQESGGDAPLAYRHDALPAAFAHLGQTLLGIEHPPGFVGALLRNGPAPLALVALAAAAWFATPPHAPEGDTRPEDHLPAPGRTRVAIGFAGAWIAAFTLATWPVVHQWSGYYYTLAAAGAAVPVALAARRLDRLALAALLAALLWWHAGGTGTRAFATEDGPWQWTSRVTPFYFQRAATLTRTLSGALLERESAPETGTRFFLAALPPWAGFQLGNGPLVRTLYRDPSLQSHFYSQFSDSTAGDAPCRFYFWDGRGLQPLYAGAADPFFQVGCDLLLMEKPAGAAHAFRRAIAGGGQREDNLYWLGWAELWSGRRAEAEAAWAGFGAADDPAAYLARFTEVRDLLLFGGDSLQARRKLLEAIRAGIGESGPHAVLGEMLWARGGEDARYGLLELQVATYLNPRDVLAQRSLVAGLAATRLDEPARRTLERLGRVMPGLERDTLLARVIRTLERRATDPGVAVFE